MSESLHSNSVLEDSLQVEDAVCTYCGCVCDDMRLQITDGRIRGFAPDCSLAERWFSSLDVPASDVARIAGRKADFETAITRAAEIIAGARAPLIYGLSRSSTPGQRAAVRLADQLGANIDTTASTCHTPSIMALQSVGESTSSLGEVLNRSDLVLYWGSNPMKSHPRHLERFVERPGQWTPRGRADRHVVVVDVKETQSTAVADSFVRIPEGGDFEVLWWLRARLCPEYDPPSATDCFGSQLGEQLEQLAERLAGCRYGSVFFGLGLTRHGVPHANVEALLRLVTDLNRVTRFVARRMRIPGDVAGADSVLCWQTGFPFSVNLARGFPRYNPGEYSAEALLERGEVDAALVVGSEGIDKLSPRAQTRLAEVPLVVLDYPGVPQTLEAEVSFTTAIYGIHRRGTAYRMDEVPIPLPQLLDSPLPADHEVLSALADASRRSRPF